VEWMMAASSNQELLLLLKPSNYSFTNGTDDQNID
jgi:hypothetical protein